MLANYLFITWNVNFRNDKFENESRSTDAFTDDIIRTRWGKVAVRDNSSAENHTLLNVLGAVS